MIKKVALTFDIEDWFCAQNMKDIHPYHAWNKCELRVHDYTRYILKMLKTKDIKATFFILGWVAERIPELVYEIMLDGHEIASHGYSHTPVTQMSVREFQKDLDKSINVLMDITGKKIKGYRAPSFSITKETLWALDILKQNGIRYDSSIYPVRHPDYGIPGFKPHIQRINGIIEVPLTSCTVLGQEIPISGGGYFRLFPYQLFKYLLCREIPHNQTVAYFHPWEFDHGQPKAKLSAFKNFRHYVGLKQNKLKFENFLRDFKFAPIENILADNNILNDLPEYDFSLNLTPAMQY